MEIFMFYDTFYVFNVTTNLYARLCIYNWAYHRQCVREFRGKQKIEKICKNDVSVEDSESFCFDSNHHKNLG